MYLVVDFVNYDAPHFGFRWGFAGEVEVKQQTCKNSKTNAGVETEACNYKDHPYAGTSYVTLKLGPVHLGTQATFKSLELSSATAVMNKRSIVAGGALVFGDTISLSYGQGWDKYRYNDARRGGDSVSPAIAADADNYRCSGVDVDGSGGEYEMIKFQGWSAALNLGPVAMKATTNQVGGWGENSGNTGEGLMKQHSEVNLSIAF